MVEYTGFFLISEIRVERQCDLPRGVPCVLCSSSTSGRRQLFEKGTFPHHALKYQLKLRVLVYYFCVIPTQSVIHPTPPKVFHPAMKKIWFKIQRLAAILCTCIVWNCLAWTVVILRGPGRRRLSRDVIWDVIWELKGPITTLGKPPRLSDRQSWLFAKALTVFIYKRTPYLCVDSINSLVD